MTLEEVLKFRKIKYFKFYRSGQIGRYVPLMARLAVLYP